MFNLDKFISDSVTFRQTSMFAADIEANKDTLTREIKDKTVCVIGGAGTIGLSITTLLAQHNEETIVNIIESSDQTLIL